MGSAFPPSIITLLLVFTATIPAFSQVENGTDKQTVRVTMTVNADGSHTSYQFDPANGKATAVTTEKDGKTRETIKYELDEKARFASGVVSGPDGRFKFKSIYKYDAAGHLEEETHLGKDSAVINRLVYSFDPTGKPTGYSVFDASGKLMGKTSSPNPSSPAKTSPSKTSPK